MGTPPTESSPGGERLEALYHRAQERIWDGREVLAACLERHGGVRIDPERRAPLARLLRVMHAGELAAWRVSAALAAGLDDPAASMAATAQAHDEARHYYVMGDYLRHLDPEVGSLPPRSHAFIRQVARARDPVRMLLGMQLMVEPVALTLFHELRRNAVEPVLCDLLRFYERDEARHVAVGRYLLPDHVARLSRVALAGVWAWQIRMYMREVDCVGELSETMQALGIEPREVLRLGQARQLRASNAIVEQLDRGLPITEFFLRLGYIRFEVEFPAESPAPPVLTRLRRGLRAAWTGEAPWPAVAEADIALLEDVD